jgi:uncharacterized protein (TIGR00297 family)
VSAPFERALIGLAAAAIIALIAWRLGALTRGGAVAAAGVGAAGVAAGWEWAGLLLAFFAGSTILGRWRAKRRHTLTDAIVEKTGARDAEQVLANGGIFALAAIGYAWTSQLPLVAVGVGALVAANADTWATEIGTVAGGEPRSILGWRRVPPGTSGAVSAYGTVATFAGAGFLASLAIVLGWPRDAALAAAAGGVAGSLADSLAGALFQQRRWCDACGCTTERRVHDCGAGTEHAGGIAWVRNDAVNFICTATGAAVAVALYP